MDICGRRIVDISYFINQLFSFPHHGLFSCTPSLVYIKGEFKNGLISTFTLSCKMCNIDYAVKSEDPKKKIFNTNAAAVNGSISIGIGYSQTCELLSSLDIPSFSREKYGKLHDELVETYNETAWTSMLEAGQEETRIAIENNEVDGEGHPLITVVADGAWSKRSYKTNYDAKSGVATIIGYKTKKVLFLGVKNKYCSVCKILGEETEHFCYKNFDGPSTAMESNIIVEGFKCSLQMHGIIYKTLVADGDSSVHKKILEARPYGDTVVEKIECRNHLLRNYCNALRVLTTKRISSENKQVPPVLRNLLRKNILRLRTAIDCATKYRMQGNELLNKKIENLKNDISNSPHHVFGDHQKCSDYFCNRKEANETNYIPQMNECGLLKDIEACSIRLKYHAKSLLRYLNNNFSEQYNNVVAKFTGGKRVNFTSRGSYQLRCNAAAVSYNAKGSFHSYFHKTVTSRSPGLYTKKFENKKLAELRRVNSIKRGRKLFQTKIKQKGPDEHYGLTSGKSLEMDSAEYLQIKDDFLKKLYITKDEANIIFETTLMQRSCDKWFSERRKRLTASNFGKISKLKATTNKNKVAHDLIVKTFFGNQSTKYGIENEQHAINDLATTLEADIVESGLFIHPEYQFLAATPDGLIGQNIIVEVKCPYSARDITPEEAILKKIVKYGKILNGKFQLNRNHPYYFQVQGQLFVCNKKFCYFAIWTPKGLMYERIKPDYDLWKTMFPKLKTFYFDNYLPILINEIFNEV